MIEIPKPSLKPVKQEMHKAACKNCPSTKKHLDPETEMILEHYSHEDKVKTAFTCGWRPSKYCKGYCDLMGITNDDLKK